MSDAAQRARRIARDPEREEIRLLAEAQAKGRTGSTVYRERQKTIDAWRASCLATKKAAAAKAKADKGPTGPE